jgi:autotransporter-associated beta strand protein
VVAEYRGTLIMNNGQARLIMNRSMFGFVGALVVMLGGSFVLQAADVSTNWTATANGNWSDGANWAGGNAATGTTGKAYFTNAIPASLTVTVNSSPWTINSLTFSNSGAYGWSLTSGTLDLAGTTPTITVNGSGSTATVYSTLSGTNGLTKAGTGTLVLTNNIWGSGGGLTVSKGTLVLASAVYSNTVATHSYVDSGKLVLQGNAAYVQTNSARYFYLGNANSNTGVLTIADSALFQAPIMYVGYSGVGAVYQIGGTNGSTSTLTIGNSAGSYGFYSLAGGVLSNVSQQVQIGYQSMGVLYQTGGTQAGGDLYVTRSTCTGVLYVTGGTISRSANPVNYGNQSGGRGEWTMAGGTGTLSTVTFGMGSAANTSTGILNLNGGLLQVNNITMTRAEAQGYLNFNGGTLQSRQNNAAFLQGISGATIYGGGAFIDTVNFTNTIAQNLLAPTASGVTALPATGTLANYLGAPYVSLSGGGGTGATAVALFDYTAGTVTGLVITCPGVGYTSAPTVTLKGGGVADNNLGSAPIGAVASGGLTKLGTGVLTLSGTNTYSGDTTLTDGGTLILSNSLALQNSALNFTNGAVKFGGNSQSYQFGGLKGASNLVLTNLNAQAPVALTVNNMADMTYSGVLSDNNKGGSLIKAGTGKLTLAGTNTYTGATTVNNGTLEVDGILGTNTVMVTNNAILSGTGFIPGVVTVAAGAVLTPGGDAGTLKIGSVAGQANLVMNGTLIAAGNAGRGTTPWLSVTGNVTIASTAILSSTNLDLLPAGGTCTVLSFTGNREGTFSNSLPSGWQIVNSGTSNGSISIRKGYAGMILRFY